MSYSWAKLSIDTLDDRVIASLPDSLWRRYHELLLIAKTEDNDGILPPVLDMAWTLRPITADALQADLAYLAKCDLAELVLLDDGDEAWLLTRYVESQTAMNSTERSRRRRQRATPTTEEPPAAPPQRGRNEDATNAQRTRNETLHRLRQETKTEEEDTEERGREEAPPPPAARPYQTMPDDLKRQRRRARVEDLTAPDPLPELVAQAPPAVRALVEVTGNWPGEDITDYLVELLGDSPRLPTLRRAWTLWRGSGYNPANYRGIAEWYQHLLADADWQPDRPNRPAANGQAAGRAPTNAERAAEEYAAMKRTLNGGSR